MACPAPGAKYVPVTQIKTDHPHQSELLYTGDLEVLEKTQYSLKGYIPDRIRYCIHVHVHLSPIMCITWFRHVRTRLSPDLQDPVRSMCTLCQEAMQEIFL